MRANMRDRREWSDMENAYSHYSATLTSLSYFQDDPYNHLCDLIDFAAELNYKLDDINKHSFNNFMLRIGVATGPLVCGVIGATKPVFDIWGDTVNEASRMDSTGVLGHIQASESLATIVNERGYAVKERGIIDVKGKGNMKTFFILGRKISRRLGRGSGATNNNLAEMVYGMVRARRRRTFKREKEQEKLEVSSTGDSQEAEQNSKSSIKLSRKNPISKSLRRLNTIRGSRPSCERVSSCGSVIEKKSASKTESVGLENAMKFWCFV